MAIEHWFGIKRGVSAHSQGPTLRRCTLAHELGHTLNNHDSTATGWLYTQQEGEADLWAANTLIDPADYRNAELIYGPHPGVIAAELGVTVHLIEVWVAHHTPQRISPHA